MNDVRCLMSVTDPKGRALRQFATIFADLRAALLRRKTMSEQVVGGYQPVPSLEILRSDVTERYARVAKIVGGGVDWRGITGYVSRYALADLAVIACHGEPAAMERAAALFDGFLAGGPAAARMPALIAGVATTDTPEQAVAVAEAYIKIARTPAV